ncbi:hypothetical protein ACFQX6_03605 [Streptosporangium lutulentum]
MKRWASSLNFAYKQLAAACPATTYATTGCASRPTPPARTAWCSPAWRNSMSPPPHRAARRRRRPHPGCGPVRGGPGGAWSNLRTKVFTFAVGGIDELTGLIKNRLKSMQYRPDLLDGFIAETGLVISDLA